MYEHWSDTLIRHCEVNGNRPCVDAIDWMRTEPDALTALANCPRGDWLLWIAVMIGVKKEKIVLASCKCSRLALVYIPDGETRPLVAIETAEKWARGDATLGDVRAAYTAAYAAATAVNAAANAAYVAAAYAAASAAYTTVAYAVAAAAYAAYAADYAADALDESLRNSADIVREMIGEEMIQSWKGILCTSTGLTY